MTLLLLSVGMTDYTCEVLHSGVASLGGLIIGDRNCPGAALPSPDS